MTREEIWDVVNAYEEKAVLIHVITEFDVVQAKMRITPYRVTALPNSFLSRLNAAA